MKNRKTAYPVRGNPSRSNAGLHGRLDRMRKASSRGWDHRKRAAVGDATTHHHQVPFGTKSQQAQKHKRRSADTFHQFTVLNKQTDANRQCPEGVLVV